MVHLLTGEPMVALQALMSEFFQSHPENALLLG